MQFSLRYSFCLFISIIFCEVVENSRIALPNSFLHKGILPFVSFLYSGKPQCSTFYYYMKVFCICQLFYAFFVFLFKTIKVIISATNPTHQIISINGIELLAIPTYFKTTNIAIKPILRPIKFAMV